MPRQELGDVYSVEHAIRERIPYLEDTGRSAHKAIYLDGWDGLAASAVLRAIAEVPPPSLIEKFDRIIHIDCSSRWNNRRALQRAIADELKLPQRVIAAFKRQDMEDDLSGVDEDSRAEIAEVTEEIYQTIRDLSCLVIFHNGSDNTIDMADFGFPRHDWYSKRINKVLWTFTGRLRVNPEIKEKVDSSHLCIYRNIGWWFQPVTAQLILEEATEVVKHMHHKQQSITPEIAAKCITYILWLQEMGGSSMVYNWATHASNYWVCDGIIGQGQLDAESWGWDWNWESATALHQQMQRMEFSSRPVRFRGHEYIYDWKTVAYTSKSGEKEILTALSPNLTSFILVFKDWIHRALPHEMFQQSERLRVLKLAWCSFSFSSPPFQCCRSLRFLALHRCNDQGRKKEDQRGRSVMELFQSLWVLDVSHMDWELDLWHDLAEQMSLNIREVHITRGRIWCRNLAWRQLQNIRKLVVTKPTSSWETGKKDEFIDMEKLELLDLSGNSTIQVLPSLSSATGLRTLVLDGCIGLDHVGPEGIPPALETFSLDARSDKLSKISLSGCVHLESFLLRGELPGLEELNLSGTSVRRVDLSDKVVQVEGLKKVFLMGCKQLHAILWWEGTRHLEVLCIGNLETEDTHPRYSVSDPSHIQHTNYVVTGDARIIQSLLIRGHVYGKDMITRSLYLNLHVPPAGSSSKCKGPSKDKIIPKPCCYSDVLLEWVSADGNDMKWHPPLDRHMEIGEGISLTDVESDKGIQAIHYVMLCINSLHVHDNSCIHDVTGGLYRRLEELKWCRVESCPKLQAVFGSCQSKLLSYGFFRLKYIWASDLPAAACIWSKGSIRDDNQSFQALESIHLHKCPRLKFALPLSQKTYLPRLETLHITQCGDLRQVFPWDDDVDVPQQYREADPVKEFPKLKHILLHDLFSLQEICEDKMTAPMIESIRIRSCWGLRRLPAVGSRNNSHRQRVVHCEKDWWKNLQWDGLYAGHHPSLYEPRYSSAYYKKHLLRGTVLR